MSPRVTDHNSAAIAREISIGPRELLAAEPSYSTSFFTDSRLIRKYVVVF